MLTIVLPRSNDHVYICLFVNIEIKKLGGIFSSQVLFLKIFDISLYSSVCRVAGSRNYIYFPFGAGSNPINFLFPFLYFCCIIFSNVSFKHYLENSFKFYTNCPSNGTLSHTKTHM